MGFFSKTNVSTGLSSNSWLINRFFVKFGYIEDGPGNDLLFSQSEMITTPIDQNPSLKKYFKEVSDQYSLSSCVANATADAFEAQIAHRRNCDPSLVEDISRLFIYWNARNLENPPAYYSDSGTRIRLAFDCMARYGAPSEKTYPYVLNKVNSRPTILSYREAIKNRISKFYRIDAVGLERIAQIKQALSAGNPVVFGIKIANNFTKYTGDSVIFNPGSGWIGSHAMIIVGWSEEKQAFEVRNSWGSGWGNAGYCWMDKNYIASDVARDLWVPTI